MAGQESNDIESLIARIGAQSPADHYDTNETRPVLCTPEGAQWHIELPGGYHVDSIPDYLTLKENLSRVALNMTSWTFPAKRNIAKFEMDVLLRYHRTEYESDLERRRNHDSTPDWYDDESALAGFSEIMRTNVSANLFYQLLDSIGQVKLSPNDVMLLYMRNCPFYQPHNSVRSDYIANYYVGDGLATVVRECISENALARAVQAQEREDTLPVELDPAKRQRQFEERQRRIIDAFIISNLPGMIPFAQSGKLLSMPEGNRGITFSSDRERQGTRLPMMNTHVCIMPDDDTPLRACTSFGPEHGVLATLTYTTMGGGDRFRGELHEVMESLVEHVLWTVKDFYKSTAAQEEEFLRECKRSYAQFCMS